MFGPCQGKTDQMNYVTMDLIKESFSPDMYTVLRQKKQFAEMTQKWCTELDIVIKKADTHAWYLQHDAPESDVTEEVYFHEFLDMYFEHSSSEFLTQYFGDPLTQLKENLRKLGGDANCNVVERQLHSMRMLQRLTQIEVDYLEKVQTLSEGMLSKLSKLKHDIFKWQHHILQGEAERQLISSPRSPPRKKSRLNDHTVDETVLDKDDVNKDDHDCADSVVEETEERAHSVDGLKVDTEEVTDVEMSKHYDLDVLQQLCKWGWGGGGSPIQLKDVSSIKKSLARQERELFRLSSGVLKQQRLIKKAAKKGRVARLACLEQVQSEKTNDGSKSRQTSRADDTVHVDRTVTTIPPSNLTDDESIACTIPEEDVESISRSTLDEENVIHAPFFTLNPDEPIIISDHEPITIETQDYNRGRRDTETIETVETRVNDETTLAESDIRDDEAQPVVNDDTTLAESDIRDDETQPYDNDETIISESDDEVPKINEVMENEVNEVMARFREWWETNVTHGLEGRRVAIGVLRHFHQDLEAQRRVDAQELDKLD